MDKNIVALVREDTKTVNVKFFPEKYMKIEDVIPGAMLVELDDLRCYKYVTTLDLQPGELCMVMVGMRPIIVEVQSVDETLEIEPNSTVQYKWIQARIDESYRQTLNEQNTELQRLLEDGYRKNARQQFRNVFLASMDSEMQTKLLGIVQGVVVK
jgi:hypothetical protein